MDSTRIISELDELQDLLRQCRSVFPTLNEDVIGHSVFDTASYYSDRGYAAQIQLQEPITAEFIERNRRLGRWINENAIIRLYGIMDYHGLLDEIQHSLPGWRAVDLMRRMRNAFTKTPLSYRPSDHDNIRLCDEVIKYFGLTTEPDEGIPTSIDAVIDPIFKSCREYIAARCAAQTRGS